MTPAVQDAPGTKAAWFLYPQFQPSPGATIVISYGSRTFTLTCVSGILPADLAPLQFLTGSTIHQTVLNIADACRRDFETNADFVIEDFGPGIAITFTQRTPSGIDNAQYDLTSCVPDPAGWASGDTSTLGVDAVPTANHAMRLALYVEQPSGEFDRIPDRSCSIFPNITPGINIAGALKPFLTPDLPEFNVPPAALKGLPAIGAFRRFYLEACEFSGSPVTSRSIEAIGSAADPLIAWNAGFQARDTDIASSFVSQLQYTTNARQFLTYRGRYAKLQVSKAQRHYLSHYSWANLPGDLPALQVSITCTDGTVVPWTTRYAQLGPYIRRTITIWAAGWSQLLLDALVPAGTIPASYKIRLIAPVVGTVLSEEKVFHLVPEDYQEIQLLYFNSVGGYDLLRATGAWDESIAPAWQITERPSVMADFGDKLAVRATSVPLGGQRTLSVQTGHLPLSEHRCVVDILGSPDVRLVDRVRSCYQRVRIAKSKEVLLEQRGAPDENLYSLQLDLLVGDVEDVVTRPFPTPISGGVLGPMGGG
jgi:hypothetical protein